MKKYIFTIDEIESLVFALTGEDVKKRDIQQWLDENKAIEKVQLSEIMKDELIKAIEEYLEGKTIAMQRWDSETVHVSAGWPISTQEIAAEIAEKVLSVVEKRIAPTKFEKDSLPISVKHLFHKGVDLYQCILNYELGVIAKDQFILEVQEIDSKWAVEQKTGWEDAPEWANYRTVNSDGRASVH
jgi:hypothetical protein